MVRPRRLRSRAASLSQSPREQVTGPASPPPQSRPAPGRLASRLAPKVYPSVVQYASRPHSVELRNLPAPEIGPHDVLLRVGAVSVCGSDIHQWEATHTWPVNVPVVLGHEFCGTVERVGEGVRGEFQPGDRVACETAAEVCGRCAFCRQGRYNLCPARKGFGYGTHGAMTTFVRVPARCLHRLPSHLSFEDAALCEPCSVAYHATLVNSTVRPGDLVVVLGPGPIGLLCARLAHLAGAYPLVVAGLGRNAARLRTALRIGATHTIDLDGEDAKERVKSLGDGLGAELVVDASGATASFRLALELVRPQGQITKVGWGPQPLDVSIDPVVGKNVRVQGSFSHYWAIWERSVALLAAGKIPTREIIGRIDPIAAWESSFRAMAEGRVIKSVLVPG